MRLNNNTQQRTPIWGFMANMCSKNMTNKLKERKIVLFDAWGTVGQRYDYKTIQ